MSEDNSSDIPAPEPEDREDIRMHYGICITDLREAKNLEWRITYQTFLLFGAIVAANKLLPNVWDGFMVAFSLITAAAAISILWQTRCAIHNRRRQIRGLEKYLFKAVLDVLRTRKTVYHDIWISIILTAVIFLGFLTSISIILSLSLELKCI